MSKCGSCVAVMFRLIELVMLDGTHFLREFSDCDSPGWRGWGGSRVFFSFVKRSGANKKRIRLKMECIVMMLLVWRATKRFTFAYGVCIFCDLEMGEFGSNAVGKFQIEFAQKHTAM